MVAPPLIEEGEAPEEQAVREQTTVVAPRAAAIPLITLSPPPLRRARRSLLLCWRVPTTGLTRKTGRAGFGPAGRGAGYYWGDTCHLSP
jgi:hypothetical protein